MEFHRRCEELARSQAEHGSRAELLATLDKLGELTALVLAERRERVRSHEELEEWRQISFGAVPQAVAEVRGAAGAVAVIPLALCMALESQYAGLELGLQLGYGAYSRPAARSGPWAVSVFDARNGALGLVLCLELTLKLIGIGIVGTSRDVWGLLDAAVTELWIVEAVRRGYEILLPDACRRTPRCGRGLQ